MADLIKVPRILWMSLLFVAILLCAASAYPLNSVLQPDPMPFVFAPALCVLAVAEAVCSFMIPAMQMKVFYRSLASGVTTERDEKADVLYRQLAPEIRVLRADRALQRRIVPRYQTALIIACAMSESIALLGALLSVFGFWPVWSVPLGVAGVVLLAIRMPTERSILRPIEKALGAKVLIV